MLGDVVKTVPRTNPALKWRIHSSEKPKLPHRPKHLQWLEILDGELTLSADFSDSKRDM